MVYHEAELMRHDLTLSGIAVLLAIAVTVSVPVFADSETITPLNEEHSLVKTVTTMYIPEDNHLPWAQVRGEIDNPAEGYPVIIQFFQGEDPVHVAQVNVDENGSYEYNFRIRDVNLQTGEVTKIFEGTYQVKIFKVINTQENLDSA